MITTVEALQSLTPNAEWVLRGDELEWLDSEQTEPTKAEIDVEVKKLQAEYASQEYARKRQAEYPSIQECVHAILDDDLDALQAKRADIKTKYPKG
jgi:hypothetical protein